MEKRALGRGIGALIPEREALSKNEIIYALTSSIQPNPFQPREEFSQQGIEELAQSIREKGVIQPLLVRRRGDNYELIAGERRLRACKSLGLNEIPVIIKDVDDKDSLEYALIENIQREKLNPIEEAHAYQHLMEKFHVTQAKMSEVLGKSDAMIGNTIRLLRLPHEIQEELKKGRIAFAHGRALLEVSDANWQRKLAQEVIARDLSVRELENIIRSRRPTVQIKRRMMAAHAHKDARLTAMEETLQQFLGTKVRISRKKKRGEISVEFYSEDDLQRIIKTIKGEGR
jgi:ParB family chromosome partitioning protein